jgi:hypothetical protein
MLSLKFCIQNIFLAILLVIYILYLALAFCDYDELQKTRKKILALYTFPRYLSYGWRKLDQVESIIS